MAEMTIDQFDKYRGRKFLLTAGTVILTALLAYLKVMDANVAMVFATAIGSFNYALRNSG